MAALEDLIGTLYDRTGYDASDYRSVPDDLAQRSLEQRVRPLDRPIPLGPSQAAPAAPGNAPGASAAVPDAPRGTPMFSGTPVEDDAPAAPPTPKPTGKPMFSGKLVEDTPRPVNNRPERLVPLRPSEPPPEPAAIDPMTGMPMPAPQTAPPNITAPPAAPPTGEFPAMQPLEGATSRGRDLSMPGVAPLDDQPFRSGGPVFDKLLGSKAGMLSGEQANAALQEKQQAVTDAENKVTEAGQARELAKLAHDEMLARAPLTGEAGDVILRRQIRARSGLNRADASLASAQSDLTDAKKALREGAPTQSGWRDTLERIPGAATDQAVDTVRGAARLGLGPMQAASAAIRAATGSKGTSVAENVDQPLDDAATAIKHKVSGELFRRDEAQNEALGSKLVQGVVSTAMFAGTGAVGRLAGYSPWLTTAIAGALPQGEQQFQQAKRAEDLTPQYAKAWMKNYGIDADQTTANELVKWSMFVTGLGIGATEAVPVAHLFERLERASGGGLTRWVGLVAAQAGEEGIQEGVQQLLENAAVKGLLDPNRELSKDVADNALVGALSGALVSGAMGAPVAFSGRQTRPGAVPPPVEPAQPNFDEANPVAAPPAATTPENPGAPATGPETVKPEEKPQQDQGPAPDVDIKVNDDAILRAYGYTDEQVAGMGRAEREAELADAKAAGVKPAETGPASNEGAKTDTASASDQSQQGASEPGHVTPPEGSPIFSGRRVGTPSARVPIETAADLEHATTVADTDYTPAQGEANNRKLGHARWNGLDISIETPAGGVRKGVDSRTGQPWETTMGAAYGYVKGTTGADGMHLDVFVGDQPSAGTVYVINETDRDTGKFRQTKSLIGFPSEESAIAAYTGTSSKSADTIGGIAAIPVAEWKAWVKGDKANRAFPITTRSVKQRPSAPKGPLSLLQMIAHEGGLKPDAELRALGMSSKNRVLIPGVGYRSVLRGAGMTMDELAERMVEHGFLDAEPGSRPGDSGRHNAIRDMIDAELRGKTVRPIHEQGAAETQASPATDDDQMEGLRDEVRGMLGETGENASTIKEFDDTGLIHRAAQIMGAEGLSADNAWEKAVMATAIDEEALTPAQMDDIYGQGTADAVLATAAPESGVDRQPEVADTRQGVPQPDAAAEGEPPGAAPRGRDELRPAEAPEADRQEGARAQGLTEATPAGDQHVLPGAEKVSDADLLQKKADQPLKPKVAQKPADEGLFGDESVQTDLVDLAKPGQREEVTEPSDARAELKRERYMIDAVRAIVSLTKGGPEAVQKAIEEGASDSKLISIAAKAGWGGSVGGAPIDRGTVEGRGKVVTVLLSPYGKDIEIKGEQLAEYIREAFPDARLTDNERAAIEWTLDKRNKAIHPKSDMANRLRAILERGRTLDEGDAHRLEGALGLHHKATEIEMVSEPNGKGGKRAIFRPKQDATAPPGAFPPSATQSRPVEPRPEGGVSDSGDLADRFAAHLGDGNGFPNILQARKFAKDAGFSEDAKKVEEAIELGVVKTARGIVAAGESQAAVFKALVDLYGRQPRLGTRTSTSMRDQAYSTPVPLAYIASRLARASEGWVAEPTAGNGALLMEVDPKQQSTTINEISGPRAKNLTEQGFLPTGADASEKGAFAEEHHKVDVVLANPPFGVVTENGASKSFDMGDIQDGYRTNEIDHAIALRTLDMMRDSGRAVLILGGPAKTAVSDVARSDAYNSKSKREFFKVLYDRYNVTDHFGVAGELYERQGAGWPVDVIVIDGRGKSARKLPAADVPRLYRSWDELGALLNERRGDAIGAGEQAREPAQSDAGSGPGQRNAGRPVNAGGGGDLNGRPGSVEPGGVQPGSVHGNAEPAHQDTGGGRAGVQPGERGEPARTGGQSVDFDAAFDAALDDVFGANAQNGPRPRTTKKVLKDTVASGAASADAAMAGLVEMFGGGKTVGQGINFDEETYARAKPLFIKAAEKFAEFAANIAELVKRMVGEMQRAYGLTREALERMRPHLRRFMDEVSQGAINLGKTAEAPRAKPEVRPSAQQEQATESQVTYVPKSEAPGLGTLVPVNMRSSIEQSLTAVEKRVGNLNTFVAKELGYDEADLGRYFGAEQVDALALAIDNFAHGKGFIIGDQTGIGKGRVNAGVIRWAIANDRIPIFVTEKPNLYGDMYRDLTDIGIQDYLGREPKMLMTNSGETVPLDDEGKMKLRSGDAEAHKKLLGSLDGSKFRESYDVVFTTYNQMQTVAEKDTARRAFLRTIAPDAVVIFDESHNAGGQKLSPLGKKVEGARPEAAGRAGFARGLIKAASGRVFYSSATYAKRPDVMDLYSATDMAMAVADPSELGDAIARGGVPMQQAVASMLAEAGQYIRRERSFAGVTYDTPVVPADKEQYDGIARSLAAIQDFSQIVKRATKDISKGLKGEAGGATMNSSTGEGGASSVNFTAVMHNLINQMLLALKVAPAADHAIAALKQGRKPVLTVANTMESFLNDYAAELGIEVGGTIEADFSRVLNRYLERTRTISIRKPFMKKGEKAEKKRLTDAELGPAGVAAYDRAAGAIENLDLTDLPISPIDAIKDRIRKAGYTVSEITGRGTIVDYSAAEARLRHRPGAELSIRGRREAINGFNNGKLDALVINQAGATGLSLHASERFKDQRQRMMIIVQAEANIDTHMQMLGRVHRTGQVIVPTYAQLIADIPAEKRPAAVLAKKMASLNANTTASRGGALTAKDVPDFINQYGDAVAHAYILDHPDVNLRLASALRANEDGTIPSDDAMRKVTGRIPLLPLKEQEEVYAQLEAEYDALLKQMDAAGENALEAKSLDLKAKTIETTEVVPPKGGSTSPFAAPVTMEKVKASRLGKPYSSAEVATRAVDELVKQSEQAKAYIEGLKEKAIELVTPENAARWIEDFGHPQGPMGKAADNLQMAIRKDAVDAFDTYKRHVLDDIEDVKKQEAERVRLDTIRDRFYEIHAMTQIGARVTLRTSNGNLSGVVLHTEQKGQPKNPLALSTWKLTIAIPDASRQITLPFSRLWERDKSDPDSETAIEIEPTPAWIESSAQTAERFDQMQSDVKEDRYIATGNLLAAYDWLNKKGQIVHFTDDQGTVRQGILTARNFKLAEHAKDKAVPLHTAGQIKEWLDRNEGRVLKTDDDAVSILKQYGGGYNVTTERAKRTGGRYYLDKQLTGMTGDFYSRGGRMMADEVRAENALPLISRLQALGARFSAPSEKPLETKKVEEPPAQSVQRLTPAAYTKRQNIYHAVRAAITQVAGYDLATRANLVDTIDQAINPEWGAAAREGNHVSGTYDYQRDLITVALADSREAVHTAYHEGWHAIEKVLTPQEHAILTREADRLRDYVARNGGHDRATMGTVEDSEVFAEAAATYAGMRDGKGLHIAVRRIFEKLYALFARIRAALNGLGFKSSESIFRDFTRGEMKARRERATFEDAFPQFGEAQSVRRRPRAPGAPRTAADTAATEIIAEQLAARGYERLAGVSQTLQVGKANPTEVRVQMQDKFLRVKHLETATERETGAPLPQAMKTYQAESLYYGRTGERLERLEQDHLDPLVADMKARDITVEQLDEFLTARHAPERNAQVSSINPDIANPSGISDADAQAILDRIDASGKRADFDAIERRVRTIINNTRDTLLASGDISPATAAAWDATYKNYVPLRGWAEGTEDDASLAAQGKGFDVRGAPSKRALGRSSRSDSPLAYVMLQAELAIVRSEKTRVGKTFLRFAQANPMDDLFTIGKGESKRVIDKDTGLVTTVSDPSWVHDPKTFGVKVAGENKFIRFHGEYGEKIARALKNMGTANMHTFVRAIASFTRLQARLATTWNPNFTIPNFIRDAGEAFINLQAQDQRRFVTQFTKHLLPSVKGAFDAISGRTGGRYAQAFRRFDKAGGRIRFFGLEDVDDIKKNVDKKLRRLDGGVINSAKDAAEAVGHGLEIVNGAIENATRLAAFMAGKDVGMTDAEAASVARELTVNFNRKGELGAMISGLYMFANASIQGTVRMVTALRHKRVRRWVYGLAAVGALTALYGISGGGDDDDGTPYYLKIPPWIRDKNLIFMFPKGFGMDGKYIAIPLPYGYAQFAVLGARLASLFYGGEKPGKAVGAIASSVIDAFDPLGKDENHIAQFAPTVARPFIHLGTNENWTGRPINPTDMPWNRNKPASTKHFDSASDFSVAAAEKMNRWTGGDKVTPGTVDLHPGTIDYLIGFITGGAGKFAKETVTTPWNAYQGEPWDPEKAPIIRRFYGGVSPAADAQSYYEARTDMQKGTTRVRGAAKEGIDIGAQPGLDWSPGKKPGSMSFQAERAFREADAQIKNEKDQIRDARADTEMTPAQRREIIRDGTERIRQIQNRTRKGFEDSRAAAR